MNRDRDFDQTLRHWLDDGADRAPERYVWAALDDVERTEQRGAWQASLEGILMKLKPAAPILGVAAVVLLAIAAIQLVGRNVGQPDPTPRAFTSADLPNIVLTEGNAPEGFTYDYQETGYQALTTPLRPGGPIIPQTGFVESLLTQLNSTEAGGYVTWSALYETSAQAQEAFVYLVNEHESQTFEGWGMDRLTDGPALGDESASFLGAAYDFDTARVHLWRVNNLVLAAVSVGDVDDPSGNELLAVAEEMDARAR
jgi:hypothetical protein